MSKLKCLLGFHDSDNLTHFEDGTAIPNYFHTVKCKHCGLVRWFGISAVWKKGYPPKKPDLPPPPLDSSHTFPGGASLKHPIHTTIGRVGATIPSWVADVVDLDEDPTQPIHGLTEEEKGVL